MAIKGVGAVDLEQGTLAPPKNFDNNAFKLQRFCLEAVAYPRGEWGGLDPLKKMV